MPSRMEKLDELLQALAVVEGNPDYRVLRRIPRRERYAEEKGTPTLHRAMLLDLETTSPDPATCEIIEFGAVRFTFDENGVIYAIEDEYDEFNQPSAPIDPIITELTGITDADVAGHRLSPQRIAEIASGVDLFIAYNADFDRRIAERYFPALFERQAWACAMRQVPWPLYGVVGGKLQHIATAAGLFYDAHRALDDCRATVHFLATMSRELPEDLDAIDDIDGALAAEIEAFVWQAERVSPMAELLDTTRGGAVRVLAHGSPIEYKDQLKARGYQWRGKKPWFIDRASKEEAAIESDWLKANIPHTRPAFVRISSRDRYSVREDALTFPEQDNDWARY